MLIAGKVNFGAGKSMNIWCIDGLSRCPILPAMVIVAWPGGPHVKSRTSLVTLNTGDP
jgi:hypothetical protein